MTHADPTADELLRLRRRLGDELRALRVAKKMSGAELARRARMSPSKINRIERAMVTATDTTMHRLALALGVGDKQRRRLLELTEALQSVGAVTSRSPRDDVPRWVERFETTQSLRVFVSLLIPALLQTPAYIRQMAAMSQGLVDVHTLQTARGRCQPLLWDPARSFAILFHERALYEEVLPALEMRAQLIHILTVSQLNNVDVHLIPKENVPSGDDCMAFYNFALLDERAVVIDQVPDVAVLQGPDEVRAYGRAWDAMAENSVHGSEASELVARAIRSLESDEVDLRAEARTA